MVFLIQYNFGIGYFKFIFESKINGILFFFFINVLFCFICGMLREGVYSFFGLFLERKDEWGEGVDFIEKNFLV